MSAAIPYKIAVLAYVFDGTGRLLLLRRRKPPNRDLYSPIGGKLEQQIGESPYACALREIEEEIGVKLTLSDLRLLGIVSERAFAGSAQGTPVGTADAAHWLMFCFEVLPRQHFPARTIAEGSLEWVAPDAMEKLDIPETDRQVIWPLVRRHARALAGAAAETFFSIHIDCTDPLHFVVTQEHPPADAQPRA